VSLTPPPRERGRRAASETSPISFLWLSLRQEIGQALLRVLGVTRIYDMPLVGDVWTLERVVAEPDFLQHFIGKFSGDNSTIFGQRSAWSTRRPGRDFDHTHARIS
jgi:hypothetical protein